MAFIFTVSINNNAKYSTTDMIHPKQCSKMDVLRDCSSLSVKAERHLRAKFIIIFRPFDAT
jgi:hypothetical protein